MSENTPYERPSKSQRKRDMQQLQELGVQLLELTQTELQSLSLPEALLEALSLARRLKSHESRRRQAQLIGKLMRDIDPEPVVTYLELRRRGLQHRTEAFHQLEQWRDQLVAGGDGAIAQLLQRYPEADRSRLRQWVRAAQAAQRQPGSGNPQRKLFRYLQQLQDTYGKR
jgi:ribosome-associated protein